MIMQLQAPTCRTQNTQIPGQDLIQLESYTYDSYDRELNKVSLVHCQLRSSA